jgi:hypothetical protein
MIDHNQKRYYAYSVVKNSYYNYPVVNINPLELRPPSSNQYCQEPATMMDKSFFKNNRKNLHKYIQISKCKRVWFKSPQIPTIFIYVENTVNISKQLKVQ